MNGPGSLYYLWALPRPRAGVPLMHRLSFGSGDSIPTGKRSKSLSALGIREFSRSRASPVSC